MERVRKSNLPEQVTTLYPKGKNKRKGRLKTTGWIILTTNMRNKM